MKKLLFVLAFAFIGGQAFSQMYMVLTQDRSVNACAIYELSLTTISPTGVITQNCINNSGNGLNLGLTAINQELNGIMNQGYKLFHIDYGVGYGDGSMQGLQTGGYINTGVTFYLAIP